ncbi:MAG: phosphoadenosine phosphosulfate reductase family protein [Thermoplasmata archaeon]|nr:phosphoadenosine phosphosulfate reductase family protein [Thermoplasmata archaeon]MCI4359132.1 phosphoadenosine phosphosulfate reductase family protein [Thermoplasmata archaeon]
MTGEGRYILSFGAGVNTAALMVLLIKKRMRFDEAVFADTGGEVPETYEFLEVARKYLAEHGKNLTVVKNKSGSLYDACTRRSVIPSKMWRWSTRDFKVYPIHAYYKTIDDHIFEYLGIAYDEIHRMKRSQADFVTSIFPLVDMRITREGCIRIIKKAGLPVPVKSGCFFCPFNNADRWREIHDTHPDLFERAVALEEGSKHFPRQNLRSGGLRNLVERRFQDQPRTRVVGDEPCGANCMV